MAVKLMGSLVLGVLAATPALADSAATPAAGIWQKHTYSFAFLGFTTTYSCDGLAAKLKILLLAAGARPDVTSRAGACASGFGRPDKFARSDLTFYTLSPASAPAPSGTSSADKPADGVWRPIELTRHHPRELSTGDCELVEQFRTNVLPLFTVRNVENHTTCIPHQDSGSVIDLKFEAFTAVPAPKAAP
jgi:hypothetical protein